MELVDLKEIVRKDSPIHYINEYHGNIIYNVNGLTLSRRIEIIIEKTAFGSSTFQVHLGDKEPEELRSNMNLLIEFINEKYKDGYFTE